MQDHVGNRNDEKHREANELSELVKYNDMGTIIGWNDEEETHDEHMVRMHDGWNQWNQQRKTDNKRNMGRGWWTILAKEQRQPKQYDSVAMIHYAKVMIVLTTTGMKDDEGAYTTPTTTPSENEWCRRQAIRPPFQQPNGRHIAHNRSSIKHMIITLINALFTCSTCCHQLVPAYLTASLLFDQLLLLMDCPSIASWCPLQLPQTIRRH